MEFMEGFAVATIVAMVVSFVIGTIFSINIGLLCIITGFIASLVCGGNGTEIVEAISSLGFIRMLGLMFLFTAANKNGTMEKFCAKLLRLAKGRRYLMPFSFALVGSVICGAGSGGLATSGLMCGPSAAMAKKARISPMLMSTTTLHGIFAGQFTLISAVAIPVFQYLESVGVFGINGKIMGWNIAIEFFAVIVAFLIFGGLKLFRERKEPVAAELEDTKDAKFNYINWITLACIVLLIVGVLLRLEIGVVALVLGMAVALVSRKQGLKESDIIRALPWGSIVLILGAMALVIVMTDSGGTALIVNAIHSLDIGRFSLLLVIAAAGLMSFYATSVPIILAVLPLAIQLCETMNMAALIPGMVISICIAGTIVDVSPLSNNGALFLASTAGLAESDEAYKKTFNQLFIYGLAQIVIWSIVCWLLFVILGI